MRISRRFCSSACGLVLGCLVVLAGIAVPRAVGWPSDNGANPLNKVHTYITEYAIQQAGGEASRYAEAIKEGANMELHELVATQRDIAIGNKYGIDVEAQRRVMGGTNEGCQDIKGWWVSALHAYRKAATLEGAESEKVRRRAYFLVGIMLHMIEDMGVPAHAHKIYHQGNATEFDNFEFMSLNNWKPALNLFRRDGSAQDDPALDYPWQYYKFSQDWTLEDSPNYHDRSSFSKTWAFANQQEKDLLQNRQGRTQKVAQWALQSAVRNFQND
jgi:hypothetical protein